MLNISISIIFFITFHIKKDILNPGERYIEEHGGRLKTVGGWAAVGEGTNPLANCYLKRMSS